MSQARKVYDEIISLAQDIFKQSIEKWNHHTSTLSFEQQVWYRCKPNKEFAEQVMKIADAELKNINQQPEINNV